MNWNLAPTTIDPELSLIYQADPELSLIYQAGPEHSLIYQVGPELSLFSPKPAGIPHPTLGDSLFSKLYDIQTKAK